MRNDKLFRNLCLYYASVWIDFGCVIRLSLERYVYPYCAENKSLGRFRMERDKMRSPKKQKTHWNFQSHNLSKISLLKLFSRPIRRRLFRLRFEILEVGEFQSRNCGGLPSQCKVICLRPKICLDSHALYMQFVPVFYTWYTIEIWKPAGHCDRQITNPVGHTGDRAGQWPMTSGYFMHW